jgi:hypothetical protein
MAVPGSPPPPISPTNTKDNTPEAPDPDSYIHQNGGMVGRSKGWLLILPPLSPPDRLTGERHVVLAAPTARWVGLVFRGYDGRVYEPINELICNLYLDGFRRILQRASGVDLFSSSDRLGIVSGYRDLAVEIENARCVQDVGRRGMIVRRVTWSRYFIEMENDVRTLGRPVD